MTQEINMTPREIVEELDRHIVGQKQAKRAVAIALRIVGAVDKLMNPYAVKSPQKIS